MKDKKFNRMSKKKVELDLINTNLNNNCFSKDFFNDNRVFKFKYSKILIIIILLVFFCISYIWIKPLILVGKEDISYFTNNDDFLKNTTTSSNYNSAKVSTELDIIKGADTSNLVELNLYDYSENINDKYITNHNYPGFQLPGGTRYTITSLKANSFNFGDNITTDLKNLITDVTTNNPGPINKVVNNANSPLSGVMKSTLGKDGYPAINNGNSEISLKYLFSDNTYATKKNTKNINGLFRYNSKTGAYTYNSRLNHAQWNQSNNSFTLYEQIITSNFMMYPFGNFLPFNDIESQATKASTINRDYFVNIQESAKTKANSSTDTTYKNAYNTLSTRLGEFVTKVDGANNNNKNWDAGFVTTQYFKASNLNKTITTNSLSNIYSIDYDEATNFFFGLDMTMNFIQPKDGLTGSDGKQPMVFEFSGDDDVFVYIDDVLFLDLSGIHRHVGGKIDFVEGKVYYYDFDPTTGDTTSLSTHKSPNPITFEQILGNKTNLNSKGTFNDYSSHTFKFYYMERGSGSGVMKMNFNLPLIEKNSITVTKELDLNDEILLGNPDFSFQILKANGVEKTNETFISKGAKYDILDTNGIKISEGIVLSNGVFKLKRGQTAVFNDIEANLGNYYVREILDPTWISQYDSVIVNGLSTTFNNNVVVGQDKFTGYESSIKNISDGHTSFVYTNKVTNNKAGSLEITKNLVGYLDMVPTKEFKIYVTLDNEPLPIGTNYRINEKDAKEVLDKGIIVIKAGETVKIDGIIAGSKFEIVEKLTSTSGYKATYKLDGIDIKDDSVIGYVNDNSTSVIVTNIEGGCDLEIPIIKIIENPDGDSYNYEFELVQVTDHTGNTLVKNSKKLVSSIQVTNINQGIFKLKYPQSDYENVSSKKLYYRITEVSNDEETNTRYDNNSYVVEVTIKNTKDEFNSSISKVWLDGKEVTNKKIQFVNQLLTDLTISKEVKTFGSKNIIFEFQLEVKNGSKLITGQYNYKTNSKEVGKITFDTNGIGLINLKDKESITIYGLPYGTTYKVTELADGYTVWYQINSRELQSGREAVGSLEKDGNIVKFINSLTSITETNKEEDNKNDVTTPNTNITTLAKTGRAMWLIPTLLGIGVLFIIISIVFNKKVKNETFK